MPVPKKRKTKSQRGNRRAHIKVEESELSECPQCGATLRPHTVCANCGYYKGEQVMKVERESETEPETETQEAEQQEQKKGKLSWENLSKS